MPSFNQANIDVKNTVETTLNRAKNWLLASYPSDVRQDAKVKIDVRYAGEKTPFEPLETFNEKKYATKSIDYAQKPTFIQIQRGKTNFVLQQQLNKGQTSFSIFIQAYNGNMYRIIQTPDGKIVDAGEPLLIQAAQRDKDFSKLVSFVKLDDKKAITSHKKWNLSQIMQKSREK